MAGATDAPMRRLCFSLGADYAVTEMVSAKAVCYRDEKTGTLASVSEGEGPVAVQLFGHEPSSVAACVPFVADCDWTTKPGRFADGSEPLNVSVRIAENHVSIVCVFNKLTSANRSVFNNSRSCNRVISVLDPSKLKSLIIP